MIYAYTQNGSIFFLHRSTFTCFFLMYRKEQKFTKNPWKNNGFSWFLLIFYEKLWNYQPQTYFYFLFMCYHTPSNSCRCRKHIWKLKDFLLTKKNMYFYICLAYLAYSRNLWKIMKNIWRKNNEDNIPSGFANFWQCGPMHLHYMNFIIFSYLLYFNSFILS